MNVTRATASSVMQAYFKTDPIYANQFKKVWLWNEFLGRKDLGGNDTGIDLLTQTFDCDYWAIQCKLELKQKNERHNKRFF